MKTGLFPSKSPKFISSNTDSLCARCTVPAVAWAPGETMTVDPVKMWEVAEVGRVSIVIRFFGLQVTEEPTSDSRA